MYFDKALEYNNKIQEKLSDISNCIAEINKPNRIIICDDDKVSQKYVEGIIKQFGNDYQIQICHDAKEAYSEFLTNNILMFILNHNCVSELINYLPKTNFPVIIYFDDDEKLERLKNEIESKKFYAIHKSKLIMLSNFVKNLSHGD